MSRAIGVMPQVIAIMQVRYISTDEIISKFALSSTQKKNLIKSIRKLAELETIKHGKEVSYKIKRIYEHKNQVPEDNVEGLPSEIRREKLIDWHLARQSLNPKIKTVEDLYELARRNKIRVYTKDEYGRKWIV